MRPTTRFAGAEALLTACIVRLLCMSDHTRAARAAISELEQHIHLVNTTTGPRPAPLELVAIRDALDSLTAAIDAIEDNVRDAR